MIQSGCAWVSYSLKIDVNNAFLQELSHILTGNLNEMDLPQIKIKQTKRRVPELSSGEFPGGGGGA